MPKPIKAVIPMCPDGGAELEGDGPDYRCPVCGEYFGPERECDPDWGYYPTAEVEVARGERDRAREELERQRLNYRKKIRDWETSYAEQFNRATRAEEALARRSAQLRRMARRLDR